MALFSQPKNQAFPRAVFFLVFWRKIDTTMASKVVTNTNPYGVVQTKGIDIVNFKEKPIDRIYINAGIYIFSQPVLKNLKKKIKKDAPEFFLELKKKIKRSSFFQLMKSGRR